LCCCHSATLRVMVSYRSRQCCLQKPTAIMVTANPVRMATSIHTSVCPESAFMMPSAACLNGDTHPNHCSRRGACSIVKKTGDSITGSMPPIPLMIPPTSAEGARLDSTSVRPATESSMGTKAHAGSKSTPMAMPGP
jgi:hypothetical protein